MTNSINLTRPGFHTVTPYVMVKEVERFIVFLKEAFGAIETHRSTGSAGGLHIEVKIGDSMLMIGGTLDGEPFPAALYLYLPDVDTVYQKALQAGATPVSGPEDHSYGDRSAWIKDSFGNTWFLATYIGE